MQIRRIYIEEDIASHPRVEGILRKFPSAVRIYIRRYGEVFNPTAQNFRLQKRNPSLILAKKHKNFVLPSPPGYGIGGKRNFYFSHMLNCPYDCRYCFLQGMYSSAHYVIFVNYEDFQNSIARISHSDSYFFSGYDCDSLAFESVSGFLDSFLPFFRDIPQKYLELRTKSVAIRPLLSTSPIENCVVAFSLSPENIVRSLEHRTPSLKRRLEAARVLWERGWKIGLRFDPLIFHRNFEQNYQGLFEEVKRALPSVHSISFGPLRFPKGMYDRIFRLYPEEPFLVGPFTYTSKVVSYSDELVDRLLGFCRRKLQDFYPEEIFFTCF
ncbi:MAG: DNA photolyase [Planctomycetota bacterium]|nr:MAG: DNA photolyase [Planctomycetota bacterium]